MTILGPWAAHWYITKVLKQAQSVYSPYKNPIPVWRHSDKGYFLEIIASVKTIPVSYDPEHLVAGVSDKKRALAECLDD